MKTVVISDQWSAPPGHHPSQLEVADLEVASFAMSDSTFDVLKQLSVIQNRPISQIIIASILMGFLVVSNDLRATVLALGAVGLTNEEMESHLRLDTAMVEATMKGNQAIRKLRDMP